MLLNHNITDPKLEMLPGGNLYPMDKEDKLMTEDTHGQWEIRTLTVLIFLRINNEGARLPCSSVPSTNSMMEEKSQWLLLMLMDMTYNF